MTDTAIILPSNQKNDNIVNCELCNDVIAPQNPLPTKRFPVKFHRFDRLCQDCYNSEKAKLAESELAEKPIVAQSLDNIVSKREEFFNAERTDIGNLPGTTFEKATALKERIKKWSDLLFEIRTRQESAQGALQELANNITKEERDKLKLQDLSYSPTILEPKKKEPRISKEDKALLSMARTLFSAKIAKGEMTEAQAIEKAKEVVRNSRASTFTKLASGELICTCASTPGICKVHCL